VAGSRSREHGLRQRVQSAAAAARRDSRPVPPADVPAGIGWLPRYVAGLALPASARHRAGGRVRATADSVVGPWQAAR
jgi:hypothetical protein